jgi:hypothetical protein
MNILLPAQRVAGHRHSCHRTQPVSLDLSCRGHFIAAKSVQILAIFICAGHAVIESSLFNGI